MNIHTTINDNAARPQTEHPRSTMDAVDSLDELHSLLEAIHMMAADLEMNQANALQRIVVIGQEMIDNIKDGLQPV